MQREELRQRIVENFKSIDIAIDTILDTDSICNSIVIAGASGVGKSYNVIKRLEAMHDSAEIEYHYLNANCTKMGLYEKFYRARHSHCVLLLDDVDVWKDEDQINILKAALETKGNQDKRIISYASTSNYLRENGIPQSFDFQGKAIFITNKNLAKIASSNNSLAPHMSAFMTRSLFIDLEIHDLESIIIHIETVMKSSNMLASYGLGMTCSEKILSFIVQNRFSLREPSLRTAVLIADIYKKYPTNWEQHCKNFFLIKDK